MKLKLLIFFFISCLYATSYAQKEVIEWLTFEELAENYPKKQKPILIFFQTEWCKFCKMQMNTTFQDTSIIMNLNKHYYCLSFDAESKETISFFERKYSFSAENGYHELAIYLGNIAGEFSFPTTVILDGKLQVSFKKSELVSKNELLRIIQPVED